MSEENVGYGYQEDEPTQGGSINVRFGLNAGTGRLVKFEWTNQGGAGGTEGEALEIQFMTEGSSRPLGYRMFPVNKAFLKDGGETTDQKSPEFQNAVKDFNAVIVHILHCFVDSETIKVALSGEISNFKDFCKVTASLLPKGYDQIPLDLFGQWQWQIKPDGKQTYLELPKNMKHGKFICAAVPALNEDGTVGTWEEKMYPNPDASIPVALKYVDGKKNLHPFQRSGWYMLSNFAKKQVAEGADVTDDTAGAAPDIAEGAAEGKSSW